MGYHIFLKVSATIKEQYIPFIEDRNHFDLDPYEWDEDDQEYIPNLGLPEELSEEDEKWFADHVLPRCGSIKDGSWGFYEYLWDPTPRLWSFTLGARARAVTDEEYLEWLKEVVVPLSDQILEAQIKHDDFGDRVTTYTDDELRGRPMVYRPTSPTVYGPTMEDYRALQASIQSMKEEIAAMQAQMAIRFADLEVQVASRLARLRHGSLSPPPELSIPSRPESAPR